jgi:hypothetical protein
MLSKFTWWEHRVPYNSIKTDEFDEEKEINVAVPVDTRTWRIWAVISGLLLLTETSYMMFHHISHGVLPGNSLSIDSPVPNCQYLQP